MASSSASGGGLVLSVSMATLKRGRGREGGREGGRVGHMEPGVCSPKFDPFLPSQGCKNQHKMIAVAQRHLTWYLDQPWEGHVHVATAVKVITY